MKKLALLTSSLSYLATSATAFAQNIQISPPSIGGSPVGYTNINDFINKALTLIFIVGVILVLVMLVWGGVEWIISGGDKEAVGKARGRIINALVGLAILAVSFAIAQVAGQFLGIDLFKNLPIPTPSR
ncbi:MAG: pilin [Candidatus Daviesbacteria bacterium]|nr:pilin [Candidatus Daviesbacteria bacterium]